LECCNNNNENFLETEGMKNTEGKTTQPVGSILELRICTRNSKMQNP
jgi:hypothetical protein